MQIHSISAGLFKLDGGAMFGVVPKSMWKKLNPPDENNMCTWAMRCMLIEEGKRLILIDTGMGNKQDDKFKSHFYPHGDDTLLSSIQKKGYTPEDITDVILSHLHFDHCGGAIYKDSRGNLMNQFPNAKYWSHSSHWEWALKPNDREKASFLKENIMPIQETGNLHFIDKSSFGLDSFSFDLANGHTEAMIIPKINYKGNTIVFAADLMPSSFHIPMPYVMSYDIRPLDTLREKEILLKNASENSHFIFFEHDPIHELSTVKYNEQGRIVLDKLLKINEL
jgi:glyoxylase-like metal-dependent hydrolase (beta-lactamase superfamily II)